MPAVSYAPREGGSSPWGRIQHVNPIIEGIWFCGTAGHGGIKLSRERQAKMPDYLRCDGGWYEEDCEWARPFIVFRDELANSKHAKNIPTAINTLRNWHPDLYERHFGVTLKEGESSRRDEELFYERHKNDWITISAVGDWHAGVPKGFVGVTAAEGGLPYWHSELPREVRYFLVPASDYGSRKRAFVVDLAKHQEVQAGFASEQVVLA